jgi:hypothetical protein
MDEGLPCGVVKHTLQGKGGGDVNSFDAFVLVIDNALTFIV